MVLILVGVGVAAYMGKLPCFPPAPGKQQPGVAKGVADVSAVAANDAMVVRAPTAAV